MLTKKEQAIDDYVKTELRHTVDLHLDKRLRWIIAVCVCVFIVYAGLAVYISTIARDVKETDRIRREAAVRELQTDSLKRETIKKFDKKYDESLKIYYKDIGHVAPKK